MKRTPGGVGLALAAAGALVSLVSGCSSSSSSPPPETSAADAGADAAPAPKQAPAWGVDAGACQPKLAAFTPPAYVPANVVPKSCTPDQATGAWKACRDQASTDATCSAWLGDAANATCRTCLLTPTTAPKLGPWLLDELTGLATDNMAGCFELMGATCGPSFQAVDACGRAACGPSCVVDKSNRASVSAYAQCMANATELCPEANKAVNDCFHTVPETVLQVCSSADPATAFAKVAALFCE